MGKGILFEREGIENYVTKKQGLSLVWTFFAHDICKRHDIYNIS